MSSRNERGLVVVGSSLAGVRAVESARALGFRGRVTLIGAEFPLPYDRPPLSKAFLTDDDPRPSWLVDETTLRDRWGVELRLGVPAAGLDVGAREVVLADGDRLAYDKLVIATGSTPRRLAGTWPAGVMTLRTLEDARRLRSSLHAAGNVVIVGGGFVGSEVASSARALGVPVTIVEAASRPMRRSVGEAAASALVQMHERHGTTVRCGVTIASVGGGDRITDVALSDGTRLPASLVVVGIGAEPAVDWLHGSGLTLDDGVLCDDRLACRGAPGVYAAGDVCRWPHPAAGGLTVRLEHWTNAAEQGAAAVHNALFPEAARPMGSLPYVWSDWYSTRLQALGRLEGEEIVLGRPETGVFAALYRDGDKVGGALVAGHPRLAATQRSAITRGNQWSTNEAEVRQMLATTPPQRIKVR